MHSATFIIIITSISWGNKEANIATIDRRRIIEYEEEEEKVGKKSCNSRACSITITFVAGTSIMVKSIAIFVNWGAHAIDQHDTKAYILTYGGALLPMRDDIISFFFFSISIFTIGLLIANIGTMSFKPIEKHIFSFSKNRFALEYPHA